MGADSLLCCGDIVGYNADPEACVDLVREKGVRCIQGNHERGLQELAQGLEPDMNPLAMEALLYTSEALGDDCRAWLLSLPEELTVEGSFCLFHGSPSYPDEYVFGAFEAAYALKALVREYPPCTNSLCFIGHTHVCAAYCFDAESGRVAEKSVGGGDLFTLRPGAHHMFNAGSCGQYRGGVPVATLCLLDDEEMTVEFRFLPYDLSAAQDKIVSAGLPPSLAARLAEGQ